MDLHQGQSVSRGGQAAIPGSLREHRGGTEVRGAGADPLRVRRRRSELSPSGTAARSLEGVQPLSCQGAYVSGGASRGSCACASVAGSTIAHRAAQRSGRRHPVATAGSNRCCRDRGGPIRCGRGNERNRNGVSGEDPHRLRWDSWRGSRLRRGRCCSPSACRIGRRVRHRTSGRRVGSCFQRDASDGHGTSSPALPRSRTFFPACEPGSGVGPTARSRPASHRRVQP